MRRVFIFFTMLCVAVMLAACTLTKDEERTTKDKGRTTNVLVTATPTRTGAIPLRPTDTATIPLPPTFTPTPTLTPTPTRTLSPAEALAARLPALGKYGHSDAAPLLWRADGDAVKLYDANNQAVAVLDTKSGALRWDSKEHFKAIEPHLIKDDLKQQLAEKLTEWKQQGIRFITFPDSEGRKEIPPYIVIPTADGKSVQMIPARKGTADFVYDAKAEKILGVFPDASGYYFVNPDGSFDLAPLQQQAETIANDLLKRGVIQHPVPAKVEIIRDAIIKAIMINPYGVTPQEINDFIKSRTGKDFAEHFDETWGKKVGVTYEQVMAATLAKSPSELFSHIDYIGQNKSPRCKSTCAVVGENDADLIYIIEEDLNPNAYYPLKLTLDKESLALKSLAYIWEKALRQGKTTEYSQNRNGDQMAEGASFALQAYIAYLYPEISPHSDDIINASINSAFKGGILY